MDDPKNDGFTYLPQILQKALSEDLCHSFMFYQNIGNLKCDSASTLLQLLPMLLHHPPENVGEVKQKAEDEQLSKSNIKNKRSNQRPSFLFARYPFFGDAHVDESDFDNLLSQCPDVDWLFPNLTMPLLLVGKQNRISGSMSTERQYVHMNSDCAWWDQCELDLMYSFLMRDGRYDESVAFVPITFTLDIRDVQKEYKSYMRVAVHDLKLREGCPQDSDEMIEKKLKIRFFTPLFSSPKFAEHTVLQVYESIMRDRLDRVINRMYRAIPGISKKVIVYPENSEHHWMATFVFNPCNISCDLDDATILEPCFYRYYPYDPSGRTAMESPMDLFGSLIFSTVATTRKKVMMLQVQTNNLNHRVFSNHSENQIEMVQSVALKDSGP